MPKANGKPFTSTSKYDHWTDGFRVNKRFLNTIYEATHALAEFTNHQAYMFYWLHHQAPTVLPDGMQKFDMGNPFMQMNVRNQLCKYEHIGLLIRIAPGVYKWTAKAHADIWNPPPCEVRCDRSVP